MARARRRQPGARRARPWLRACRRRPVALAAIADSVALSATKSAKASVVLAALAAGVEPDDEHGAEDRRDPSRLVALVAGEGPHDEAGDKGAGDAGQDRGQATHGAAAGQDEAGEGTHDEAEDGVGNDVADHGGLVCPTHGRGAG